MIIKTLVSLILRHWIISVVEMHFIYGVYALSPFKLYYILDLWEIPISCSFQDIFYGWHNYDFLRASLCQALRCVCCKDCFTKKKSWSFDIEFHISIFHIPKDEVEDIVAQLWHLRKEQKHEVLSNLPSHSSLRIKVWGTRPSCERCSLFHGRKRAPHP